MKRNLLLMMLCCPLVLVAQNGNGVTVSNLAVDAGTVTFNVSWQTPMPVAPWSDTVWVFVDYNKNGVMERLPVTGATASAGTVMKLPDNDKGVWIAGNARTQGSFSATVKLLTAVKNVGGACVYGSNYPPVGEYKNNATEISFIGTPMYEISLAKSGGKVATVKSGDTFILPYDYTVTSFTDATGAPGLLSCILPFAYTLSGADVCMGTNATLTLSGSQSGWRYQLYKGDIPVGNPKDGMGNALAFSEASTSVGRFNYTVRTLDATGEQCEIQVSNVHGITVNPVPTITRSGGNASQTVNQNTAITTIVYTASNAATIFPSGSCFPAGVSGIPSGNLYTISGTPSVAGTFDYALTAAVGGCTSAASVGTLTVNAVATTTPPYAASTKTWTVGNQIWSDVINVPECDHDAFTNSTTDPYCRSYSIDGIKWYYYNWVYVNKNLKTLCPAQWRVPTTDDFTVLDKALGGSGQDRSNVPLTWITAHYLREWGSELNGWVNGIMQGVGDALVYWSDEVSSTGRYLCVYTDGRIYLAYAASKVHGFNVRCVK
jgi:uncharacterized protein (TIGR02145 family)